MMWTCRSHRPIAIAIIGLACLLCVSTSAMAADRALLASQAALICAETADAITSYGGLELNPLLADAHSKFGVKGVAIKAGFTAGIVLAERPIIRRWPKSRRTFLVVNWVGAAVTAAVAGYNLQVPR